MPTNKRNSSAGGQGGTKKPRKGSGGRTTTGSPAAKAATAAKGSGGRTTTRSAGTKAATATSQAVGGTAASWQSIVGGTATSWQSMVEKVKLKSLSVDLRKVATAYQKGDDLCSVVDDVEAVGKKLGLPIPFVPLLGVVIDLIKHVKGDTSGVDNASLEALTINGVVGRVSNNLYDEKTNMHCTVTNAFNALKKRIGNKNCTVAEAPLEQARSLQELLQVGGHQPSFGETLNNFPRLKQHANYGSIETILDVASQALFQKGLSTEQKQELANIANTSIGFKNFNHVAPKVLLQYQKYETSLGYELCGQTMQDIFKGTPRYGGPEKPHLVLVPAHYPKKNNVVFFLYDTETATCFPSHEGSFFRLGTKFRIEGKGEGYDKITKFLFPHKTSHTHPFFKPLPCFYLWNKNAQPWPPPKFGDDASDDGKPYAAL